MIWHDMRRTRHASYRPRSSDADGQSRARCLLYLGAMDRARMNRTRCWLRFALSSLAALLVLFQLRVCRAEDTGPPETNLHRLSLVVGYDPLSYTYSEYEHLEGRRDENPTRHARAGYAYRAAQGLEVGGAVTTAFTNPVVFLLPQATIRGFLTLLEHPAIDVGLSGRVGALIGVDAGDVGTALTAAADIRVWPTRYLALFVGTSALVAQGTSSDPPHKVAYLTLAPIEFGVTIAP